MGEISRDVKGMAGIVAEQIAVWETRARGEAEDSMQNHSVREDSGQGNCGEGRGRSGLGVS